MADQIAEANVDGAQLQECPALYELVVQLLSPPQREPARQEEAQAHGAGAEGCNAELASAPPQRDAGEKFLEEDVALASFKIGDEVTVGGLESNALFNGKSGFIVGYQGDRLQVCISIYRYM